MSVSPLTLAFIYNDLPKFRRFLAEGSDPNERSDLGETPLILAARGCHLDFVQTLVDAGCDLDATDKNGDCALHAAVNSASPAMLDLLLAGANPNIENNHGETPLERSLIIRDNRPMLCLLDAGARFASTAIERVGRRIQEQREIRPSVFDPLVVARLESAMLASNARRVARRTAADPRRGADESPGL